MGHVDWLSMESCRKVMEVNYFGVYAVIKRFLQLLKRTRGSRIINISSAAGFSGLPNMGVYCGTIHHSSALTLMLLLMLLLSVWGGL